MMERYAVILRCDACMQHVHVAVPVLDAGDKWQVVEGEPQIASWAAAHRLPKMEPIGLVPSA